MLKKYKSKSLVAIFLIFFFYVVGTSSFFFNHPPIVSIIIKKGNNLNGTINCINSILKAEVSTFYEIIVINRNFENDMQLLKKQYYKNSSNIFFHKVNNFLNIYDQVAKICKGKYILFLKDNTKVYKNWLSFLLTQIENNDKIGIVGSKLIYQNETLIEAGGIIWNNGEYSNYGRGNNVNLPEYNYIKEVDFVSGVSFIIKKSVFKKIGGFDEKFISSYYKYIDLALNLRKHGYKIIYNPLSSVEYFNEISNRKNNLSKIENYKKKFIEKWKDELKNQLEQNNLFMGRDRCINKRRILVIDSFVPNFDKDAGGRCCFMYLNIFKEIGLKVTFLGDDPSKIEPYTTILQQKGIEVLYGNSYKKQKLRIWLKSNLKYFHFIYLQRPDISIKYIEFAKKYSSGKIFYFAHDLHHIRLLREFNITHNLKIFKKSQYIKKIESEIFSKADIIHVVGSYEFNILKEKFRNKIIRNIPLYIYDKQQKNIEKDFSKRKNLLFVGSKHSPNIDGILWFSKKIFTKIIKKFPNIILYIISSASSKRIKKLESKNIKILGYLSDENLHIMYQKCRIAIAPLRFGSGIKGKIIEAAYNQIPMVTTSIGGEGIDKSIGSFIMEDNPKKMAELISKLYTDYSKLKQMSDSGKILIEKYFSKKKAKEIILRDIQL